MRYRMHIAVVVTAAVFTGSLIAAQEAPQARQAPQAAQGPQDPNSDQRTENQMSADLQRRLPSLSAHEVARVVRGFRIAPVQLDLKGKDLVLVGLGSYLVNAAGACNDCHTAPPFAAGGDPFAGEPKRVNAEHYLAGGTPFGPVITSRNLTPDAEGRPAGLTYEQFRETMQTGQDQKNAHPEVSPLLQVMPWPVYQDLTERDLRAIYEFLRAIPHAEPGTPTP